MIPHHIYEPEQLNCDSASEVVPEECLAELKTEARSQGIHNLLTHASARLNNAIKCEDFSTLKRLLKVTALVMKFVALLRPRAKGEEMTAMISTVDIANAELSWIKLSQTFVHDEKFNVHYQQLAVFCDKDDVWRCKGRLHHADLPESSKHPILLDKSNYFTTLIVRDCHARVMHSGVKATLTERGQGSG